ncbi:MAG: hypothetical protein JXA04_00640 [Gammaproteobacteria bacterium]|nr:hypothetical protein [Gammaproteobacteria bacterium]
MPCKIESTTFRFHYLLLVAILMVFGCKSDLTANSSSTTNAESPAIKATIYVNTIVETSQATGLSGRVTDIRARFYDLSGGNETQITLAEGDTMTATAPYNGAVYDFRHNNYGWSARIMAGTATATVEYDASNEMLRLKPVWVDADNDVIAVVGDLYRSTDLTAATISLDLYLPEAYVTYVADANMQIQILLRDGQGVDALLPQTDVSSLNGDAWNTIPISNISASMLTVNDGENFNLQDVYFLAIQFISNGKAISIDDDILLDNISIAVPSTIQESAFALSYVGVNAAGGDDLVHLTRYYGGIQGKPLTISVDRETVPVTNPWFPINDTTAPNFDDLLFYATTTINLPDIEITSPKSSDPDDDTTHYEVGADSVTIEWSPSGTTDEISIEYLNNCGLGYGYDPDGLAPRKTITGDPGFVTLPIEDLLAEQTASDGTKYYETVSCIVYIKMIRKTTGVIDPAFSAGSEIVANHESYIVSLISIPPAS